MGFYKTSNCFFTKQTVLTCDEPNGKQLDGYYYQILFYDNVREIRLSHNDDWANDSWMKKNGISFINLIENKNRWEFFDSARTLQQVKNLFAILNSNSNQL